MTHELPRAADVRAIYLVLTSSAVELTESGEVDVRSFADDSRALPPPDLLVARGSTLADLEGLADRPHVLAVTKAADLDEAHRVGTMLGGQFTRASSVLLASPVGG